ncbi:hypothetical protein TIFTF001_021388 [Ficus carica]|uniref:Uncharacterized protein n=1 Tax=Ficus carica TaxID=3494 RepID=A0AA88DJS8_FICCA|nr:hypothetical protein TIFTF001_021388 [Ficus carica]
MESKSRKRKACQVYDEEEEKIEEFYTLIKSIREARNRLMKGSNHHDVVDRDHHIKEEKQFAVWKPSFRCEDFIEDHRDRDDDDKELKNPLKGSDDDDQKEEIVKEELDLRLSL